MIILFHRLGLVGPRKLAVLSWGVLWHKLKERRYNGKGRQNQVSQ